MKLVEKIAKFLVVIDRPVPPNKIDAYWEDLTHPERHSFRSDAKDIYQLFLSDPNIVEIDPDAELPENPYCLETEYDYHEGAEHYKSLLAGWVKKK